MRILHILDHSVPLQSGYSFRTLALLQQQQALGWETFQVTSAKHVAEAAASVERVDGWRFYRTPALQQPWAQWPLLNQWAVVSGLRQRLQALIPKIKPDVLHVHSPALNGWAALPLARQFGLPLVYECRAFWEDAAVDHGTTHAGSARYRLSRAVETQVFKRADAVTTICEGLRDDIVARGVPAARVTVIPNAVACQQFRYAPLADRSLQQALGLTGKTVLGFIGSFYGYEGLLWLLEQAAEWLKQRPQLHLLLVGGGPQQAALKQAVSRLGLQASVSIIGRVAHGLVPRYYSLLDVCLYPRLPMRLTELVTPLKPLEAMAQGRLVVASAVGGHRELIRDGETGFLFTAGDGASLLATLERLLQQRAQWPVLLSQARHYVEQQRSWQASVGRYDAVYTQAMGGRHG